MKASVLLCALSALLLAPPAAAAPEVGAAASDLPIPAEGKRTTLATLVGGEGSRALVVWFASTDCPWSLKAEERVRKAWPGLDERGVRLLALFPNTGETPAKVREHAGEPGWPGEFRIDPAGRSARAFGAEVTPTFFVFDADGVLRFRGGPDGAGAALEALLAGGEVVEPLTPATGCTIRWPTERPPDRPAHPDPVRPPAAPREQPAPPGERPAPERGERRASRAELSPAAAEWLEDLLRGLASPDPAVRRSAAAGLAALGPGARSRLREVRSVAQGVLREELDRFLARTEGRDDGMRRGPGPDVGRGAARFGGSVLARERRMIEENLDLTDEQKAALDESFPGLEERARALRERIRSGERQGLREEFAAFREAVRATLDGILTPEQRERLRELRSRRGRGFGGRGGRRPGGGR